MRGTREEEENDVHVWGCYESCFIPSQGGAIDVKSILDSTKYPGHTRMVMQSCRGDSALEGLRSFYFLLFTTVHELLNIVLGVSQFSVNFKGRRQQLP